MVAGRVTGPRRLPSVQQDGRESHTSCRLICPPDYTHCSNSTLASQLLTSRRHQLGTIHRLHPGAHTKPRIHLRASTSRTGFDVYYAVLRRAILGTQFFLRAHVFRSFARLDTHCRNGQRRERKQPREDVRLVRAMGGRAQEASVWGRPISHFGVLVKLNFCMSSAAAQSDADRQRFAAAPSFIRVNQTPAIFTYVCIYILG